MCEFLQIITWRK